MTNRHTILLNYSTKNSQKINIRLLVNAISHIINKFHIAIHQNLKLQMIFLRCIRNSMVFCINNYLIQESVPMNPYK
jgi:hypothetical protein